MLSSMLNELISATIHSTDSPPVTSGMSMNAVSRRFGDQPDADRCHAELDQQPQLPRQAAAVVEQAEQHEHASRRQQHPELGRLATRCPPGAAGRTPAPAPRSRALAPPARAPACRARTCRSRRARSPARRRAASASYAPSARPADRSGPSSRRSGGRNRSPEARRSGSVQPSRRRRGRMRSSRTNVGDCEHIHRSPTRLIPAAIAADTRGSGGKIHDSRPADNRDRSTAGLPTFPDENAASPPQKSRG